MLLTLHGTGAGNPNADRMASSATLELPSGDLLLVDAGEACARAMLRDGVDLGRISDIIISHFHGDHWTGIPGLVTAWASRRRSRPVRFHLPRGGEEFLRDLLVRSYSFLERLPYRLEFHGHGPFSPAEGVTVHPFATTHLADVREIARERGFEEEAFGFRFELEGRRLVMSQDLGAVSDLEGEIEGCALLVCESTHVEPAEVLDLAVERGVGRVIFTHVPADAPDFPWEDSRIAWAVADDGLRVVL